MRKYVYLLICTSLGRYRRKEENWWENVKIDKDSTDSEKEINRKENKKGSKAEEMQTKRE